MGPLQLLLFGFEDFQVTGNIAQELEKLSDAGVIRIIDARLLFKETDNTLVALRVSDLDDEERAELRVAASALVGLGAGAVMTGTAEGAAAGAVVFADAAMDMDDSALDDDEIGEIADGMEQGDAMILLLIENVWATGLRNAIRDAGPIFFRQDYVTPGGLVALGAMLGLEVAD